MRPSTMSNLFRAARFNHHKRDFAQKTQHRFELEQGTLGFGGSESGWYVR